MKRLVIAITGATGVILGIRILEILQKNSNVQTYLILSDFAKKNIEIETDYSSIDVYKLADHVYEFNDMTAPLASGSFQTDGMIIAPCSIKTLSAISNSYNDNLIVRSADCMLKERKKLVILPRETPLHSGHINIMKQASDLGAVILPPVLTFYNKPETVDDMINHIVGKTLDQFSIDMNLYKRWEGTDI